MKIISLHRRQPVVIFFTALFLVFGILTQATLAHTNTENPIFHIKDDGFVPRSLEINVGDTVIFENDGSVDHWPASNIHPTHEIYSEFDPRKPLPPGQSWTFTFTKSGEWQFHDHVFPHLTGTIYVNPADTERITAEPKTGFFSSIVRTIKSVLGRIQAFFTGFFSPEKSKSDTIFTKAEIEERLNTEEKIGEESTSLQSAQERDIEGEKNLKDIDLISLAEAYSEFEFDCPNDFSCAAKSLREIVEQHGPFTALRILERLQQDNRIDKSVDEHQLAHQIGRQTAETFGVKSEAFQSCDTTFNYGCQHGFFEYVLGRTPSTKDAATIICESLNDDYSTKFKFYCYHGVGHGIMMAQAYDLEAALDTCDTLENHFAQDGCWQGVFMENANAGTRGESREGVFFQENPLAPCDSIEKKYRHECFINHAGWLMQVFNNDVSRASQACLEAPDEASVLSCMQSIGLMVTNPSWQVSLYQGPLTENVEIAAYLCEQFPQSHQAQCVLGAIDNIMNFDELNVKRGAQFCTIIDENYQSKCYNRIGTSLASQSTNKNEVRQLCEELNDHTGDCLEGAGLY